MGTRAYAADSDVRRMVEKGGFEEKAAETSVEVAQQVVSEATENLASKEFVESEIKKQRDHIDAKFGAQKEYMDAKFEAQDKSIEARFEAQKEYIETKLEAMRDYIDLKMEVMSKSQRLEFVFLVIAAIALMQGVNWLIRSLG